MLRVAMKGVLAHKGRLLLTSLAVVIGTAFLSGTYIFTDTISRSFNDLFADVFDETDAYVRSSNAIDLDFGAEQRDRVPDTIVDTVASVPGVLDAQALVQGFARMVDKDGDPLGAEQGPPTFGGTANSGDLSPWTWVEGEPPRGPDEVSIDRGTAKKGDFSLGDTVRITAAGGSREFTITGIVTFGSVDAPAGATYALFAQDTAEEFVAKPGLIDAVMVKGDGSVSEAELSRRIQSAVEAAGYADVETITGTQITEETQDDIEENLRFFNIFLSAFSYVALAVSVFVIYNVFSITAAQRRKEHALLRAVGANKGQIRVAVLTEAVVVGVVGSFLGLVGGIGISRLLNVLLQAFGVDIPSSGLTLLPRTVTVTLVVGLVVTVISALLPAFRAGRVLPVEAMRDAAVDQERRTWPRLVVGLVLLALGVLAAVSGVVGTDAAQLGLGGLVVLVAVFVLGPLLARPVARLLGTPIAAATGITGQMARENAVRHPKRTARTAFALVIGVALVTGFTALASSARESIREIFGEQFQGDFAVTTQSFGFGGLPTTLADQLNELPEVGTAAGVGINFASLDGAGQQLTVVDPARIGEVFDLEAVAGDIGDLTADGLAVSESRAEADGLQLGSQVSFVLLDGSPRTLTVQFIYAKDELAGAYTVSRDLFSGTSADVFDFAIFITKADGVSEAAAGSAIEQLVDGFGNGKFQSRSEYIDAQTQQINQFLGLLYGLLFLSILIAMVGIVITLVLSVYERRRELGLVRAVGMTRPQVWSSVSWESVITSLLGAVQGIVLGLALGYAFVASLRDEGFNSFTVPVVGVVVLVVLAFVAGVVAAIYPAYRATKVNILESIATF